MSEHTKGPWHTGGNGTIVYDAGGWAVASAAVFHGRHAGIEEAEANAALIAAAPDLLEALRSALELIEVLTPMEGEVVRKARAAIARVEASKP